MKTTSARRYIVAAVFLTVAILAAGQIEQTAATVAALVLSLLASLAAILSAAQAEADARRRQVDDKNKLI